MKRAIAMSSIVASMLMASPGAAAELTLLDTVQDPARQRAYRLSAEGVEVRDAGTGRRIAQIALPDWTWVHAQFSCPPALALTPEGDLLVTSNVVPTFWRIGAGTLRASVHAPRLDRDAGREPGFVALRWSREARAYVATAQNGERWRIDRSLQSARRLTGAGAGVQDRECLLPSQDL